MNRPSVSATVPAPPDHSGNGVPGARRRARRGFGADGVWKAGDLFALKRANLKTVPMTLTFVGFTAFVFVIVTYRLPVGDVAMALALVGLLFQKQGIRFPPFLLALWLFGVWAALGLASTPYPLEVKESILELWKVLLIYVAGVNALRSRGQFRFFLVFFVVAYMTHPVRGALFNRFIYGYGLNGRAIWNHIFENPNDLAAITLLLFSVSLGLLATEPRGWIRKGALASSVILPILILLTQSRGVLMGLVAFGALAFAGQRKSARTFAMVGVFAMTAFFLVPSSAWDRLGQVSSNSEELADLDDQGSAEERFEIWRVARTVVRENFVSGVGWEAYPWAHSVTVWRSPGLYALNYRPRDAHSTYLTVLAETGIIGFLLWLSAIALAVLDAEATRRRAKFLMPRAARQLALLEYGLAGFMLAALFGSYAHITFFYIQLVLIWASTSLLKADLKAMKQMKAMSAKRSRGLVNPRRHSEVMPTPPGMPAPEVLPIEVL